MNTLFRDFRSQISWGRVCACVALVVSVIREFQNAPLEHVGMWLGVASGSYGMSKGTEVIAYLKGFSHSDQPEAQS